MLLNEIGNNPVKFDLVVSDDEYWEIRAEEIGLSLYLSRGMGEKTRKLDTVYIEFAVNGSYNVTGTGNSIVVFSTVRSILSKYLNGFIDSADRTVTFGSEKIEPSRVKLYNRCVPVVSQILGNGWKYSPTNEPDRSLQTYVWQRATLKESLLLEKPVQSTWITDLRYSRTKKEMIMTLSNGRKYLIPGVTRATSDQWTRWPSKGKYFHSRIKGKYQVTRVS